MISIIKDFVYALFKLLPINRKKVFLFSYYGEQYSGSPKYIGNYLAYSTDLEIVWAFVNRQKHISFAGKSVKYGHLLYYYHLATAGTIITNYRMTQDFKKRDGQKYIQTWHSSLRLKMIENDAVESLPPHYVEMAKKDSAQIDYLLSGSEKSSSIFQQSFWYAGDIVNTGTPQCDILFEDNAPYAQKVRAHYGIAPNTHIALYAPTFRNDGNLDIYKLDFDGIIASLQTRFGGTWVILLRLHPHLSQMADFIDYSGALYSASDYDDVQELLCAADILISDYSAIMFDFALTHRPCFLYTPDLDTYMAKDRKLYFQVDELPFSIAKAKENLQENILRFSQETYASCLQNFLSEIGSYDDGHASERVGNLILEGLK